MAKEEEKAVKEKQETSFDTIVRSYVESGYFGEDISDTKEISRYWLRKIIAQENGEVFFNQDYWLGVNSEVDDEDDCEEY